MAKSSQEYAAYIIQRWVERFNDVEKFHDVLTAVIEDVKREYYDKGYNDGMDTK